MHVSSLMIALAGAAMIAPAWAEAPGEPGEPRASEVESLIVGGAPVADIAETPWQVALVTGGPARDQFCGGSLVAPEWVLTAAHCVDNARIALDPSRLEAVGGTLTYASGGEQIAVTEIHVHPDWDDATMDFDAALLRLASPAELASPIPLAEADAPVEEGVAVRVSGWGAVSESGPGSERLLFAEPPVVTNETCNQPESYDGGILDSMFCAGAREGGLDSCQGDSGGPVDSGGAVTPDTRLVGVVSWGEGCARALKYGVYTRVSAISDWANEMMGQ